MSSNGDKPTDKPPGETASGPAPDSASDEKTPRKGIDQLLPDVVKRAVFAGLGAVFSTEEGIRKAASEFHLPKDVANYLLQQAGNSKDEVLRIVAKELRSFLETVNINQELQKLLTSLSLEVKTEIHFIPNDNAVGGVKPEIKKDVSIKRRKDEP